MSNADALNHLDEAPDYIEQALEEVERDIAVEEVDNLRYMAEDYKSGLYTDSVKI